MVTKKKATKKAAKSTKKAARKVATKAKATTKAKASSKSKVASKSTKSTKKVASKSTASRKAAVKRVRKPATPKQPVQLIVGTPTTVYKVLANRGDRPSRPRYTSIFAKGALRGVFSDKRFTNQVDPSLPITAFESLSYAQRFANRNRRHQRSPWVIVQGEGVRAFSPPQRAMRISNGVMASLAKLTPREIANKISYNRGARWAKGTVFVQNFRIVKIVEALPVAK